jgi:hypothetical protein
VIQDCFAAGSLASAGASGQFTAGIDVSGGINKSYFAGTVENKQLSSYRIVVGIGGTDMPDGSLQTTNSASLAHSISGTNAARISIQYHNSGSQLYPQLTNNYAFSGALVNGVTVSDAATSPQNDINGLGKTAAQLKQRSTYETGLGWDFDNVWEMGPANYPYPILKWMNGVVPIPEGFTVISD